MECDGARILMIDALDGDPGPELTNHVASCPDCAREMRALCAVDALLRSQPPVEPPPHFPSRVMSYIDVRMRSMPRWQVGLMRAGVIVTGVALVAIALGSLLHGWRIALGTLVPAGAVGAWLVPFRVGVTILADNAPPGVAVGLLAGMLALVMALSWFGVLVVPRHGPATEAARARRR